MMFLLGGLVTCLLLWITAILIDVAAPRCPLVMYIRDTRYLTAPMNAALYLGVPPAARTPLLPIDETLFPNLQVFRHNWRRILEEAAQVCDPQLARSDHGFAFNGIGGNNWRQFFIRWHGTRDATAAALCPLTTRLVDGAPEIKIAFFSILEPNSDIKPHVGPYRGVVRYQMGLRTPNDPRCYISVAGKRHTYRDGTDVIFDDTYVHAATNGCSEPRIILFLDIERPLRHWSFRTLNRVLLRIFALFPGKTNENSPILGPRRAGA